MYQILQKDDDLLLVIDSQPTAPDGPLFIYDGGDTALLFRDWDSNIRLNHISEIARPALQSASEIYVFETRGDEILRDYIAPVRIVRDVKGLMA